MRSGLSGYLSSCFVAVVLFNCRVGFCFVLFFVSCSTDFSSPLKAQVGEGRHSEGALVWPLLGYEPPVEPWASGSLSPSLHVSCLSTLPSARH